MWLLIVLLALAVVPAHMARKTGRPVWLWFLYGVVAWPVATIHVYIARPVAEGGTGSAGRIVAVITGILTGFLTIVFVSIAFMPDEAWEAAMLEAAKEDAKQQSLEQQKTSQRDVVDDPKEEVKLPDYRIEEEQDTSHGAANRIGFWARLVDDQITKAGIRLVVKDVVDRNRGEFDIIWVYVIPADGRPRGEGFYGWVPVICSAKWISPSLDEQYHTTSAGPNTGEDLDGIVVAWSMEAEARQAERVQAERDYPKKSEVPVVAAHKTEQEPEPTFNPSTVIVRLQHPLFYSEAADMQWKRNVLSDGQERWVGTVDSLLIFAITPDWLYVMGSIANTALTSKTLLALYELNSIAMPDNYEKVNNEILPGMIDEAALETNSTQSRREFAGWLLELEGLQAITSISYRISRLPER